MKNSLPLPLLTLLFLIFVVSTLSSQSGLQTERFYNTKRNFIFLNAGTGGGDYPFASLGITLSRQFFNGETMAGIGVQYIGNTATSNWVDPVQVFPIMVDFRQKFMESRNSRFAAFITAGAGYVISIIPTIEDELGIYEFKNGWGVSPGLAFRFNVFENIGLMVDVNWFHHEHPQIWTAPVEQTTTKIWNTGLVRGNVFF